MTKSLLTTGNPKIEKGVAFGYYPAILHLSPYRLSGKNVCANASPGCIFCCLNTAGHGGIFKAGETTNTVQEARLARTRFYLKDRGGFYTALEGDIEAHARRAKRIGLIPVYRLDGTSDLGFGIRFASAFRDFQFYDYTKNPSRADRYLKGKYPENYHLTFSLSEKNLTESLGFLKRGLNVAAVFDKVPAMYLTRPVLNGDLHDLRFLDPTPRWVGLKAKGRAKKDTTGFVIRLDSVKARV